MEMEKNSEKYSPKESGARIAQKLSIFSENISLKTKIPKTDRMKEIRKNRFTLKYSHTTGRLNEQFIHTYAIQRTTTLMAKGHTASSRMRLLWSWTSIGGCVIVSVCVHAKVCEQTSDSFSATCCRSTFKHLQRLRGSVWPHEMKHNKNGRLMVDAKWLKINGDII